MSRPRLTSALATKIKAPCTKVTASSAIITLKNISRSLQHLNLQDENQERKPRPSSRSRTEQGDGAGANELLSSNELSL